MTSEKRWICPECANEFGEDFLRCTCGYEGVPVFSAREDILAKKPAAAKIPGRNNGFLDSQDMHLSAEEFLRKAELEYQKLSSKRAANERLNRKLREKLEKANKLTRDDPFEILGVHRTDSIDTIHRAYRAIVAIYHPDKHGSATEDSRKQKNNHLASINAAYGKILALHKKKLAATKVKRNA
jgi:hypothetical protein